MFINPMWFHESQRIGKQKCTPTGYILHTISDFIGFIALTCLIGVLIYLGYASVQEQFNWSMTWFLAVPFTIALVGNLLHSYSWYLADKRQFKFDYETSTATWVDESGNSQSYEYGNAENDSGVNDARDGESQAPLSQL